MPIRIAGITIPDNKRIEVALTYVYGVGRNSAKKILQDAGIDADVRTKDLTETETSKIRDLVEQRHRLEGDLRRDTATNIRRLKDIGCYRGMRHAKHLPVRGQRTRTNSRTVRGNIRKTAGSGRRPAAEKT